MNLLEPFTSISSVSITMNHVQSLEQSGISRQVEKTNPKQYENELTEEEQKQVIQLEKRDREVRSHEMAHLAAAGAYAKGGAHFEFQKGPDGKRYAVGGSVAIDTSVVSGDPQATIQKMQIVRRAALAPSNPSGSDRSIAAKAAQNESKARMESQQNTSEKTGYEKGSNKSRNTNLSCYSKSGIGLYDNSTDATSNIDLLA